MSVECLCFWLFCWLCLELLRVRLLIMQLTLTLAVVIGVVCMLCILELDLLATFILAVYSSVFVALSILALHFGPFWLAASLGGSTAKPLWPLFSLVIVLCVVFVETGLGASSAGALLKAQFAALFVTWQDLGVDIATADAGASLTLHWLFYRLMVWETVGLNLYLFLGLMGTLTLVYLRTTAIDAAAATDVGLQSGRASSQATETGLRTRLAARFRRQTRRTNGSQIRFK